MNNKNILFYLSTCDTCLNLIKMCKNYNILQKFELICIDGKIKYFVSKGINVVPTMCVSGINKPFIGKECFIWLDTIININKPLQYGTNQDKQNINKQQDIFSIKATPPPPIIKNIEPKIKDLIGFRKDEMTGISDNYAFKDIDNAFPKNFQYKNSNFEIYTGDEGKRLDKKEQEKMTRDFNYERTNDIEEFTRINEDKIKSIL